MSKDTMSGAEMAILAAQTRANLARLTEFISWSAETEAALAVVDEQMKGIVEEHAG